MRITVTSASQSLGQDILTDEQREQIRKLRGSSAKFSLVIYNNGSKTIYFEFLKTGDVTTDSGIPLASGDHMAFADFNIDDLRLIVATGTNDNVRITAN